MLILPYECTTWTLTKCTEKKLDGNYTRILRAILNQSWRLHQHKAAAVQPFTTQIRQTRHAGHCWRSRDELISDILLWTPSHGWAKAGRPARTYIQQLCADTGCSLEDLPEAMDGSEGWRERVREIHADGTTWWLFPLHYSSDFLIAATAWRQDYSEVTLKPPQVIVRNLKPVCQTKYCFVNKITKIKPLIRLLST